MENLFEVHAEARTDEGKGASRRLRHAGKVPAVVYGTEKNRSQFLWIITSLSAIWLKKRFMRTF